MEGGDDEDDDDDGGRGALEALNDAVGAVAEAELVAGGGARGMVGREGSGDGGVAQARGGHGGGAVTSEVRQPSSVEPQSQPQAQPGMDGAQGESQE